MDLTLKLKKDGFSLENICEEDLDDFIFAEKMTHYKYVAEHEEFFGGWNEKKLQDAFDAKRKMTFFQKLRWNGETVGFLSYDQNTEKIDNVFIRIMEKAQKVIKSNPAQNLYKKLDFECYKEQDVFYYFKYEP